MANTILSNFMQNGVVSAQEVASKPASYVIYREATTNCIIIVVGHCKTLAPKWGQVAAENNDTNFEFLQVECSSNDKLCRKAAVSFCSPSLVYDL